MTTSTRTRKSNKKTVADKSEGLRQGSAPLLFGEAVDTEMVTLERIDNQKNQLMNSCYFKKMG